MSPETCSLKLNYDKVAGGDLVLGGEHEEANDVILAP